MTAKAALNAAFRRYTIATYAANFDEFSGERFEIDPEIRPAGADRIVQTRIVPAKGDTIRLDFVMRESHSAQHLVFREFLGFGFDHHHGRSRCSHHQIEAPFGKIKDGVLKCAIRLDRGADEIVPQILLLRAAGFNADDPAAKAFRAGIADLPRTRRQKG